MKEDFRFPFDPLTEQRLREKIAVLEKAQPKLPAIAEGGSLFFRTLDKQFRGEWTSLPWMMTLIRTTVVPLRNLFRRMKGS